MYALTHQLSKGQISGPKFCYGEMQHGGLLRPVLYSICQQPQREVNLQLCSSAD